MARIHTPRNDFVIFRLMLTGRMGSLVAPQSAQQGRKRIVIAIGPDVEDLKVGDEVYVIGSVGQDVIALPDDKDLYVTRQSNVILKVSDLPDEE